MAKNINALKISQEIRNSAPIAQRQPAPPGNALYLMQVRAHGLKSSAARQLRQRLHVTVERDPKSEIPQPIKITHAD